MTVTTSEGQAGMQPQSSTAESEADPRNPGTPPGSVHGPALGSDVSNPLNAAIAATADEVVQGPSNIPHGPPMMRATGDERDAAMSAYISAGVAAATAHMAGDQIVTVAALRVTLTKLFEHLHLDHPENYLPKG